MKMICTEAGNWQQEDTQKLQRLDLEIHANGSATARYEGRVFIIDRRQVQYAFKKMGKSVLGFSTDNKGGTVLNSTGIFWAAFIEYIFPVLLDIAKVYCCVKICQAFLQERNGSGGSDGRSGYQALVHYGKFYILFTLIPWFVELVDQIGHTMASKLAHKGIDAKGVYTNMYE
jgi:hypothetical protein